MPFLLLCWYVQDLTQVLLSTAFLAPEIFMLALNAQTIAKEDLAPWWYLVPFMGGLLFDLRWTGVVGLCSTLYPLAFFLFRWFWFSKLPRDGRTKAPFVFANEVMCLVLLVTRMAFWRGDGSLGHLVWLGLFAALLSQPPLWLMANLAPYEDDAPHF